ncbi:MAG: DUF262 domain-containing HNH endonuclease family protein [Aestuariivita sp.]|nr:DUF262 domain-containing HNH endonuclease family protein [Aestuariivita sp.]
MPIDVENIFKGRSQSSWSFLITNGQGCYIPAYQRPYSWSMDDVSRLLEDVVEGLNTLKEREQTITFLGTLITIHDIKYRTIMPIYRQEVPPKVSTIIDGQQRLCTFAMLNIAMHNAGSAILKQIQRFRTEPFVWLDDQLKIMTANLLQSLIIDMNAGADEHRYYPRVVRSYDDAWSKRRTEARYDSPIARLIWRYFLHVNGKSNDAFRYEAPTLDNGQADIAHTSIIQVFKGIGRKLNSIMENSDRDIEFPSTFDLIQSDSFVEGLWNHDIDGSVKRYLSEGQADKGFRVFSKAIRLLILAKYLSDRVAFTVVTTDNEDDAFDMFEALNTTGQPLTAFETFKPKIIEAESVENYDGSDSQDCVKNIESYLEHFEKAEARQSATSEMLLPFALSETGEKLQNKLNAQRKYLRDQFDDSALTPIDKKRSFLERLSNLATYMLQAWRAPHGHAPAFGDIDLTEKIDQEALVGFDLLRKLKHHITIAPLSRFFGAALSAEGDPKRIAERDFLDAVRATVSFSVLWRAAFGGTNNIDSVYRAVMSEHGENGEPPLAFRPRSGIGDVSLANYTRALRRALEKEGIHEFEGWSQKLKQVQIYKQKHLARFILFTASHDTVNDEAAPGLIKSGREGVAPLLNYGSWNDSDYYTVEHIAPQINPDTWDSSIYPDSVHTIGNLTLLPLAENDLVANRTWSHKRAIYRVLSAATEEEFEQRKLECEKIGLNLSATGQRILENSKYLSMCRSLGELSGDWTLHFIEERSDRLARLAWNKLAP